MRTYQLNAEKGFFNGGYPPFGYKVVTVDCGTYKKRKLEPAPEIAPIVKEVLLNPNDADIQAKAQQYTLDFFGKLEGWEGIYIADWNSKVLTHPAPPVIGKVMREGDSLKSLQDSMINSENGVYNTGIITSPASGELIISMYAPVYDGDKIIGYVGVGTFM